MDRIKNINIIDNIYTDATFNNRYGLDIFLTILIVVVMLCFIGYWIILNNLQSIRTNWASEKCNPMYMPFVHIINPDPTLTADQQISENANQCLKDSANNLAGGSLKDIYAKLGGINDIINDFHKFINFMNVLFLWLFNIIAYGINYLLSALQKTFLGVTHIFLKVESMFNKFIGVLLTNFFIFIQLFNMAIAFILNCECYDNCSSNNDSIDFICNRTWTRSSYCDLYRFGDIWFFYASNFIYYINSGFIINSGSSGNIIYYDYCYKRINTNSKYR